MISWMTTDSVKFIPTSSGTSVQMEVFWYWNSKFRVTYLVQSKYCISYTDCSWKHGRLHCIDESSYTTSLPNISSVPIQQRQETYLHITKASPAHLSYPIYFLSPLPITLFYFNSQCYSRLLNESMDRVKGGILYIWARGRYVLAITKIFWY
jgi:hypothetical protein